MKKKKVVRAKSTTKTKKSRKGFWYSLFGLFAVLTLAYAVFSPISTTQVLGASTSNQLAFNFRLCNQWAGGKCQKSCNSSTQVKSSDHCIWPSSGTCCYPKPKLPGGYPAGGPGYPTPRTHVF